MDIKIIEEYKATYIGFDLSHGDHIEGYTVRKLSSGDYEIYVEEGNQVTGGALTGSLYKSEIEGKTYEEVVKMLPECYFLEDEFLKNEDLKSFLGFGDDNRSELS